MKIPPYPPLTKGGWGDFHAKPRKEKGFILVILLALLLLLAVTAMSLNFKAGMQGRMATNRTVDAQTYLDQLAVIEQSVWKLTGDPSWRTVPAGEDYPYQGRTYNRKVFGPDTATYSALIDYKDAIIVSVTAPYALRPVNKSFRYNISNPLPPVAKPRQACADSAGNIIFADYDNHSIWKMDALSGAILRVAGTGKSGFSGDGGLATLAQLDSPSGVCVDTSGNIYIADTNNNRIRKIAAGIISTVVNTTGGGGSSGDEGLAMAARLNSPSGVWADALGNLYIADMDKNITDTGNNRIRKVTVATGIITTIVNTSGNRTDGTHPLGDGGAATAATLNGPRSVFVDSDMNIFISDTGNDRIRKVTAADGYISTIAGTSNGYAVDGGAATLARLNSPYGVWVDASGNIFIADSGNHRIRKVTAADGYINTIVNTAGVAGYSGDGGTATTARIDWPTGVCVKNTGEVIIADTNNSCLRQVSLTNIISTLPMTVGPGLNSPQGMATYYDAVLKKLFLYIADSANHRIRKLDTATNALVTVAGTGTATEPAGYPVDNILAVNTTLNSPTGVAVDTSGNLYIADTVNNKIRQVKAVAGVITDSSCSSNCSNIITVAGTGVAGYSGDKGDATAAQLNGPQGVAIDSKGDIFITDTNNHRIRKIKNDEITTVAGTGVAGYSGDGGICAAAQLDTPTGIFINMVNDLYIADTNNHCIRKIVNTNSIISTVAGVGSAGYSGDGAAATAAQLNIPQAVAVDGAGNIYIADTGNHALRLVNNPAATIDHGVIRTMAGTKTNNGYNGDNQPAAQAWLRSPAGVALGMTKGGGRIYIGDTKNNRVRTLFLKSEPQVYGP
ncbi:MAG: hypothetical protein M0P74_04570 [Syntrophales bacterium]|jgi:sugar lactone lactonase YvrE|nr:hypothetical protein [Syntrophales bacterium]